MASDSTAGATGDRKTLPRDLADFLIQLSIALHRYAMYPGGHPSLAPTVEAALERLGNLLHDRETLSLGVARNQLVIEGVATDASNPVLRELAGRLHRHHLGAVTFARGVGYDELHEMLEILAVEADRTGEPVGLNPRYRIGAWPHVRLYPLTYDRLELVDEGNAAPPTEEAESRGARTRAAQLWVGLARAALASEQASQGAAAVADTGVPTQPAGTPDAEADAAMRDPTAVARAIDQHRRDAAYDQVIVGYMLQIADELKGGATPESGALKRRVSQLVSTLEDDTLQRLLEMGGDRGQQRRFLLSAAEGMTVDAVLELVRAASATQGQTISHSMLRMLQKLAHHAEAGRGQRRVLADQSVRDQISALVRGWSLKDPNPDEYRVALQSMATSNPVFAVAPDRQYLPEPQRLIEMALEVGVMGDAVERAADELITAGRLPWLLDTIQAAHASDVTEALWRRVATPARVGEVLRIDPIDTTLLDLLIRRLGVEAADPMLDVLTGSESTQTRRAILARLAALGPAVGPYLVRRLSDERWFVQRNMLALLGELNDLPEGFSALPFAEHPEARVRREAFRLLLRAPETRERAICLGLADADERAVRLALTACSQGCPDSAVPLLVSCATGGTNVDQRVTAIRLLGAVRQPLALETLLAVAAPRKTWRGVRPPPKSREYLASLVALQAWGSDARARNALAVAARSRDAEISAAALGTAGDGHQG